MSTQQKFHIVGVAGQANTGKDTVAQYLQSQWNLAQLAFATPIKSALCAMFGVGDEVWDTREIKEAPVDIAGVTQSWRDLAKSLGTEWGRNLIGEALWVNLGFHQVESINRDREFYEANNLSTDFWHGVVFSDVRYPDEGERILKQGGKLIYLTRPGFNKEATHASENLQWAEDVWQRRDLGQVAKIINDGTLEQLFEAVADAMRLFGVPEYTGFECAPPADYASIVGSN